VALAVVAAVATGQPELLGRVKPVAVVEILVPLPVVAVGMVALARLLLLTDARVEEVLA
jgi:hypothetical protein